MKRVLCLYRVSTIGQVDHDDIPMQRLACHEFISQHPDWMLFEEVLEKGVSGYKTKTADRDALTEIKEKALAKKFDVLLVFMFDRLGRREDETPFVVQWFVENGIEVWSTKEGEQRFDTHVDKLLNYIRFWQASGESEKTSMRIRTKHLQMIQEGLYRGGLIPFGYQLYYLGRVNKKNQPVRDLVIDEGEGKIVTEIYSKIINEGWGANRIANWLNELRIPTKHGKPGAFWRATSIRAIVRNPIYTGRIRFGDELSEPIDRLRLIDDYTFELCEQTITERIPAESKNRTHNLRSTSAGLLTGILFCGSCGGRLCFNHNKTVRKLADGTKRCYERDVYRCYRKINNYSGCAGKTTYVVERIEEDVIRVVRHYFATIRSTPTRDMLAAASTRTHSINSDALTRAEEVLKKAQSELNALEEEAVKALTGESRMDISFINSLIPKRRANLDKAFADVQQIRSTIENDKREQEMLAQELDIILSWADAFDHANNDTKRSIIAALIDRITVYNDYSLDIHFRISASQYLGGSSVIVRNLTWQFAPKTQKSVLKTNSARIFFFFRQGEKSSMAVHLFIFQ